ncbi:MAG: AraC family ligand binding domain-containing protein, partial [Muribaculaceae bacterium]|nr:AraC family ligand binding domain-containing protein [Muribaculaceae bacterium]
MEKLNDVIISGSIEGIGTERYKDYVAHALCTGGSSTFSFNGRRFEFNDGDLMIVRKGELLDDIRQSDDFAVRNLYVTASFIELCTPQSNYGMRGQLALFLNPVMHLTDEQRFVCER